MSARPTFTVGEQENASLADGLLTLLIVEDINGLYRCEATFGNWGSAKNALDYLYFDRRTLDFGKSFKVKLGTDTLFDGRITAIEGHFHKTGPRNIASLAEDRFQDLRMARRTRTFSDLSDSDLFNRIANEHGLSPSVNVSGPKHKVLSQINQSDLAFLRERARSIDAELWMDGNTLHAKSRASRNGGTRKMTYGGELHEFTVLADLAHQRTSVAVSGWDVASKSALKHEASDSVITGELDGLTSGASILSSGFGQRKESIVHTIPLTAQEAQTQAESYFKMNARRFVVGRGICDLSSQLRVGSYVDLRSLGALFNGKYYLTEVRHTFDFANGLRTAFTAERPGLGQP